MPKGSFEKDLLIASLPISVLFLTLLPYFCFIFRALDISPNFLQCYSAQMLFRAHLNQAFYTTYQDSSYLAWSTSEEHKSTANLVLTSSSVKANE